MDFKNTLIIMTSNIGARQLKDFGEGVGVTTATRIENSEENNKAVIEKALKRTFSPEFLNRIDDVIMVQPLMLKEIREIVRMQLNDLKNQLLKSGVVLEFSEYALDYLSENGFDPQFGARPLKRLIQKQIINQLSKKILSGTINKTHPVLVDVFDGVVVFRNDVNAHETSKI